ncbi:MAG: pyruvate formate lyase family protein [Candidatus Faecivicinus sp.]
MLKGYRPGQIVEMAKALFREERALKRLDGWFYAREAAMSVSEDAPLERKAANELRRMIMALPLELSANAVFAGTQRDAFARTYALINPSFRVETFSGYCDPTAVFDDIVPEGEITRERVDALRRRTTDSAYVRDLMKVYETYDNYIGEVVFFVEQVTGHVIPDFRGVLKYGVKELIAGIKNRMSGVCDEERRMNLQAMIDSLECAVLLAGRYADLAREQLASADAERRPQLELIIETLERVPALGARNLYEAIQSFMLLWQVMCLEQAPNPFALSVGNADRIFEPYRAMTDMSREEAAELLSCLLVFFNVGDRSWAISQNVLIGGRDVQGNDLTNPTSYALLDAYFEMMLPQPILSVKLHRNTPDALYRELGRFFFTPGMLTPSLFNDDSLFEILAESGVETGDLADYSVAGCQEPLIMGKDSGNTTNSWLNMGKVLELVLNHGDSLITGKHLMDAEAPSDPKALLENIRPLFYAALECAAKAMAEAANGATAALSNLRVPFLSAFMGGAETGYDMRDTANQGTRYNGSGCLIHGLSVVADSFVAIDHLLKERPEDCERLLRALRNDFADDPELREYLRACPKFGNNIPESDREAAEIAERVSDLVASLRNNWGNPFRPDWSSPSTHLTYGYWVGALPDGRKSREMLGYGVDPLFGDAQQGLGFRTLSAFALPYGKFSGGYASHFGIDPKYFTAPTLEEKGMQMKNRVIAPLFFNPGNEKLSPFYLYMNVTTPETLRKVLANPKKYAPSGVYIMRIHGTFVNFLDLSPAIQQDIITRLDSNSTRL